MTSFFPQRTVSFLAHEDGVTSAAFSPDGATLATSGYDKFVRLWDVGAWREKQALPGHRRGHVAFAPDGRRLISGGLHKDAVIWNVSPWEVAGVLAESSGVWSLAYRPDGSQIVLIEPNDETQESSHGPIEFWNPHTGELIRTIDIELDPISSLAFSPNGEFASLSSPPGGSVSLWNADFTEKRHNFIAHDQAVFGQAYSPDGAILATGGADNVARLWDTVTWELRSELMHEPLSDTAGYSNSMLCAAFSPNGKLLVTGGLDGALTVWSLSVSPENACGAVS